jgi:predicted nucleotidyltransferase
MLSLTHLKQRMIPLFRKPDLQLAILFGSRGKGEPQPNSDYDLAVQFDGTADLVALTNETMQLLGVTDVDLVDLRRVSSLLLMQVATSGVVLHEREPGLFRRFQSLAYRRYWDTTKFRRAQKRALEVFLANKGLR